MKNNILQTIIIIFFLSTNFLTANDDLEFESKSLEIINSSNEIHAKDGVEVTDNRGLKMFGETGIYKKNEEILELKNNVSVIDENKNIELNTEKIFFNKKLNLILSEKKTIIFFNDLYIIEGNDISFDRNNSIISSNNKARITDNFDNELNLNGFKLNLIDKLLRSKKIDFLDKDKNKYNSNLAMINLSDESIASKDVEIYFANGELGQNARLKGLSFKSENNISEISNAIFTTCKIKEDNCPPWSFKAKKISHDKKNKTINYHNSWLNLYDKPVFYFPRFFHPDPTVERQSGFLIPSINSSSTNGSSIKIPYFQVVDINKDFTISPQIFFNNDFLLQNEYRQEEKNTSHISDFSIKKLEKSSKSHFFTNTKKTIYNNFELSELEINLEKTSNDTYLKSDKLKINTKQNYNQSLLNSYVKFNATSEDYKIFSELSIYEDLTKNKNSDKYQYVYPNFTLSKLIKTPFDEKGKLNFETSGSNRKKETNINETHLINDFEYSSNSFFSKYGFISNFDVHFKNTIKKGNNSKDYSEETETQNYSSFLFNSSLPMNKNHSNYTSNLNPKILFSFNPDKSENLTNLDRKINTTNIFSKNRLSLNDSIEGGQSITLGFDYDLLDKMSNKISGFSLGQIYRDTNDKRLPIKTKMQNKTSDIVGKFYFNPSEAFNINYDFSADNNLDTINSSKIETDFKVNNFVTSFEFLEENNEIGTESYFQSNIKYNFNNSGSILYNTRRNRKTNLTEYYNLIYEYKNDCLVAAIEYNKDYYQDRDLKPNEQIFFKLTITPFASVNTPSLK